MSQNVSQIEVTSHVGRDLLASARLFREDKDVVWEYVVNSLQYVERGVKPRVQVVVRPRKRWIEIRDNGCGMDAAGLAHYFEMHGENLDRLKGRGGRGKFGTGKSAAFGIAHRLRVESRREGLLNVVELTRDAIDTSTGDNIPLDWQIRNRPTDLPNGTAVTVSEVQTTIRTQRIIEYIERHLQAFRASEPEVAVNDHVCTYVEPEVEGVPILFEPSDSQSQVLGDVVLKVQVSRAPLTDSEIGVVVTAGEGNTIAVETGGIERKEFGNYILGTIDVPALDEEIDGIDAYDSTRSLVLNQNHVVAAQLIAFIGAKLEEVRRTLVKTAREAAKTEQARRLEKEADRIAEVLNKDFVEVRRRLREIRSASASPGSASATFGDALEAGAETDDWVEGVSTPGEVETTTPGKKGTGPKGRPDPEIPSAGRQSDDGPDTVDPAGGSGNRSRKPRGGFNVAYRNLGSHSARSEFDTNTLSILINLDHPVVAAALGDGSVEDPTFKRLSYEIAFAEYSIGLGYQILASDPNVPSDDILFEVRDTLNRVARGAASLYR